MADTTYAYTPGSGGTAAIDRIASVDYPYYKVKWGVPGTVNDASAATPFPVGIIGTPAVTLASTTITGTIAATQSGTWNIGSITTLPALVAGTAHIGEVKIDPTQIGSLVAGGVPVVSGGFEYEACPISATTTLGATGAVGDYLEGLNCVVGTAATSLVQIKDGSDAAIDVLPSNVGGGVGSYYVPLGLISRTGAWQVITLAGTKVLATGNFT